MLIKRRFLCLIFCSLLHNTPLLAEQKTIRSSVSPILANGLHTEYMQYLASKANMKLDIQPMPFARRIKMMRQGELDVITGLQLRILPTKDIIYLDPPYEQLNHTFFILNKNQHKLSSFADLKELAIGVTRWATYFERFEKEDELIMVGVNSLQKKIKLLRNGRIDTFIHYQQSTEPTLQKMGLTNEIVVADFQATTLQDYHFAISARSPLISHKKLFEKLIAEGVAQGDFARIRQQYYLKKNDRKKRTN